MSTTSHKIEITGVNKTGPAFAGIANAARSVSSTLSGVFAPALAAAAGYLSFRAVKGGIEELGHLSDIAMKTGQSADDLTRMATAMDVLGIQNMGIDQLGKAFDYMLKTTGRSGKEGFLATIEELAAIPNMAERGQAAMKTFGRTGMELMPIINAAAANGVENLRVVVDAMPGVTSAAATQGDAIADAMTVASNGVKSIWLNALGTVAGYFGEIFGFGVTGAAAAMVAQLEFYAKALVVSLKSEWMEVTKWTSAFGAGYGGFFGALFSGAGLQGAVDVGAEHFGQEYEERDQEIYDYDRSNEQRLMAWRETLDRRIEAARKLDEASSKAAISANAGEVTAAEDKSKTKKAIREPAIRNELIAAGSNAAMKIALGTNDTKQVELLSEIAANTRRAAESTNGEKHEILEVID